MSQRKRNMTRAARPNQIAEILKTIAAEYPNDMGADLEVYIADLEANQPDRPPQIAAILKTIDTDHPLDMGMFLETYISALEAGQRTTPSGKKGTLRDPERQYWQGVEREKQRRSRAVRKPYQG
jgi:hypothetical protein